MKVFADVFAVGSLLVAYIARDHWNMRDYLLTVAVLYVVICLCGGRKADVS